MKHTSSVIELLLHSEQRENLHTSEWVRLTVT